MREQHENDREADRRLATVLRGDPETLDLLHPARQWVPSGTNLGHQPPLMIAGGVARHSAEGATAGRSPPLNELRLASQPLLDFHQTARRTRRRKPWRVCSLAATVEAEGRLVTCHPSQIRRRLLLEFVAATASAPLPQFVLQPDRRCGRTVLSLQPAVFMASKRFV
jgi:hypothetical protein